MSALQAPQKHEARQILSKARERKGLDWQEALCLLSAASADKQIEEELSALAREIKAELYGSRVVLFAPLYLSNYCVNGCVYCPFNCGNTAIPRRKLTQEEIRREVIALQDMGHKRLALESGEHPDYSPLDYILESIDTIYSIKHRNGAIRRVNVNIAATTQEEYRRLKGAKIGTYLLFQETYHEETYRKIHPPVAGSVGMKHDYDYHLNAPARAMAGGIEDIGLGVLFGLYQDPLYEFAALLMHAQSLERIHGVGPHTISLPRIRSADGVRNDKTFGAGITDAAFIRIVAALRVSVPYTGIIVSTRESADCRLRALAAGVSQISGGSRTSVGGYSEAANREESRKAAQFKISDERSLDEIVQWLLENDYLPSFCTACYNEGRVGEAFMGLVKGGKIKAHCQSNAQITLREYLTDYASEPTRLIAEKKGLL
ncbi:MAG: [FeFe] hydrogenase H-cluster radical SAM maturase HydG [Oscillospiraceae bacterium]|nr:[FeFe] hydrogenase H-cluster radical SAM maturase HydG [Oscillospiraceae bacterium]